MTIDDVLKAEGFCACLAPSGEPGQRCRCGGSIASASEARAFWSDQVAAGRATSPDEMHRQLQGLAALIDRRR